MCFQQTLLDLSQYMMFCWAMHSLFHKAQLACLCSAPAPPSLLLFLVASWLLEVLADQVACLCGAACS